MESTTEDLGELRCWDKLVPDVLGLIFTRLSLKEVLTLVPCVCKSWREVTLGPYCWQEIDIYEWSISYWGKTAIVDRMLEMLLIRTDGCCRKLCIDGLPNDYCFSFIAYRGKSLQMLRLTWGEMSDSIVEQLANRLVNLTYLDLSSCANIGKGALEAFGKHCKLLSTLVRLRHPSEQKGSQDEEAFAIATTMPKLSHLEICYMHISTQSCLEIISNCSQLKTLDIRGCWDVKLDDKFMKKKYANLNVVGPHIDDIFWDNLDTEFDDYSYASVVTLDDWYDFSSMDAADIQSRKSTKNTISDGCCRVSPESCY